MTQGAPKERLRPFKPQRFGRYTLLRPLSTGGMGEIFLAHLEGAQGFEKLCVIKKILPHLARDKDFVDRFVDEARILVKLSHGNIAQVLDMGLHDGAPYIALEFVDGKDLRRVLSRARERSLQLPLSFSLYVMTRLLDALAYAHRKKGDDGRELNLVHRDVSPQNILISYEGEVKVIDFGLAKSTLSATRTHPSIVLGKFLYMAPEQARHQKVDRRSDLYAVGLCLYELVASKSPFEGVSPGELMSVVANPAIAPLQQVEPLCPPALAEVVMKALSPDPALRFQTAEELRGRLLAILLELDPSAGPETATRFMTEAFAGEYQTERKMLAELKAQARSLTEPELPEKDTLELATRTTREVPAALPPLTLEEVPSPAPPAATGGAPVEALSFEPTRKAPPPPSAKSQGPEAPGGPSIVVDLRDGPGEEGQASVMLEDELALERATRPETRAARGLARKAPARPSGTRPAASRTTGSRPAPTFEKPSAPNVIAPRATPFEPLEAATREPAKTPGETPEPAGGPSVAATPAKKPGGLLVWLSLPLLAILAVGTYIVWDLQMNRAPAEESVPAPVPEPVEVRRSREVKVPGTEPEPASPDELAAPGKPPPPKKPPPAAPKAISKPAMLTKVRSLIDDVPASRGKIRFTARLSELEKQAAQPGNEAEFSGQVRALEAEVKAALESP